MLEIPWLNPIPCMFAVYASGPAVTVRTCNTRYRAARYALPGRVFHPLDRASLAWRTRRFLDPP